MTQEKQKVLQVKEQEQDSDQVNPGEKKKKPKMHYIFDPYEVIAQENLTAQQKQDWKKEKIQGIRSHHRLLIKLQKIKCNVLVHFYAAWCQYDREIEALVEAKCKAKNVAFLRVNIDKRPKFSKAFRVLALPTLRIVNCLGQPLYEIMGNIDEAAIERIITKIDLKKREYEPDDSSSEELDKEEKLKIQEYLVKQRPVKLAEQAQEARQRKERYDYIMNRN